MPRGGRRPGAGAPRGNLNALRGGGRSRRLQIVLAALLSEPEIRMLFIGLLLAGDAAHAEFRELVVRSARVLYERPISEEMRELAARIATAHIAKLGAVGIREAVLRYRGQLGLQDLLPPSGRTFAPRPNSRVVREFCRLILGIDPEKKLLRYNQSKATPSRPSSLNLNTISPPPPSLEQSKQSNPHAAASS